MAIEQHSEDINSSAGHQVGCDFIIQEFISCYFCTLLRKPASLLSYKKK